LHDEYDHLTRGRHSSGGRPGLSTPVFLPSDMRQKGEGKKMTPITVDAIRNRPVPICACCKQIRNDSAEWEHLEAYLFSHFGIEFTHTLCPVHLTVAMKTLH
jgi:hypothetical protein